MDITLIIEKLYKKRLYKVLVIIFIILTIGTLYQNIMLNYESKKYNPPGQLIDVYNHKMHIYGEGSGSPTVILTVGSGTPCAYTDYYFIQREISKIARTVVYDRAGYGWSEKTFIPRTIDQQVKELHELLNKYGEKPPYILVGHSLSSLEVIRYAQLFPKEVSGIILIDGGNPTYYANLNEKLSIIGNYLKGELRKCGFVRVLGNIGILTPLVGENKRAKLLPETLSKMDKMIFYKTLGNENNRSEIRHINENAKKVVDNGKLQDMPLIILTSEQNTIFKDSQWEKTQLELKDWSTNSKQEEIKGSTHYIHWDKPNVVIDRIKDLINSSKGIVY